MAADYTHWRAIDRCSMARPYYSRRLAPRAFADLREPMHRP